VWEAAEWPVTGPPAASVSDMRTENAPSTGGMRTVTSWGLSGTASPRVLPPALRRNRILPWFSPPFSGETRATIQRAFRARVQHSTQ